MEYFKTQKGETGLIYNGFKYMVNRKTTSITFRRCSVRKYVGRVTTESTTVKITAKYLYPANEAKLEAKRLKIMLKSTAKESTAPIQNYNKELLQELRTLETENVSNEEVISYFKTLPSMTTSLYRGQTGTAAPNALCQG